MSLARSVRFASQVMRNKQVRAFSTSHTFLAEKNVQAQDLHEPTPVRLHDVTPNPLPKTLTPTHQEDLENYWLTMPTLFERAVGSERAELLNQHIYDDLLVRLFFFHSHFLVAKAFFFRHHQKANNIFFSQTYFLITID